jgi:phage-related minor tail protein
MAESITVGINADAGPLEQTLTDLQGLSDKFGTSLTGALKGAAVSGKDLNDVLRQIALSLSGSALSQGLKPLENLASSLFSSLFGGASGALPFAKGGVVPFASGGVVSSPTYFPLGSGFGVAGEAGSEAILPLKRGADGSLGVAAGGGGSVNVVFNVTTQDASSFRKSESQVTSMLARAVSRGARSL